MFSSLRITSNRNKTLTVIGGAGGGSGGGGVVYPDYGLAYAEGLTDEENFAARYTIANKAAAYFAMHDADGVGNPATSATQQFANLVPSTSDVMTRGSTTGTDTNDPSVYYNSTAEPLFLFNRVTGFSAVRSNPAVLVTPTTSFGVTIDFGPEGYLTNTTGGTACPGGWANASNRGIFFYANTSNQPWVFFGDGTTSSNKVISSTTLTSAVRYIRSTLTFGANIVTETSADGVSWTTIDTTSAGAISSFGSASMALAIGALPYATNVNQWHGRLKGITLTVDGAVWDTIDADLWFAQGESQTSFLSLNGRTASFIRATTGLKPIGVAPGKSVAQADGTDDYFQLPASCTPVTGEATGSLTVLQMQRTYGTSGGGNRRWFSSEAGPAATNGITLYTANGSAISGFYHGGTASSTASHSAPRSSDTVDVVGIKHVSGSMQMYKYGSGLGVSSSTAGDGDASHTTPRLFVLPSSSSNWGNEDYFATVVFHEDLTEEEMDAVSEYLLDFT